ncbi:hypothetical protein M8818_004605 [Zalaria obscura]|uniref:Uncharacterized protein n=1 Tax=Zalaria obscura TaxID=2024903 RepID=A0ACC3SEP2_9PEZI
MSVIPMSRRNWEAGETSRGRRTVTPRWTITVVASGVGPGQAESKIAGQGPRGSGAHVGVRHSEVRCFETWNLEIDIS